MSVKEIIEKLKSKANPENIEGMAKFGISSEKRLGISMPELRQMGKEIGRNHSLAVELWKSGIPEARILASLVDEPDKLTEKQMEDWVKDFNSWDVCDQVCMNLFEKTPLAWKKAHDWSVRKEEFVKRTAFSLIACMAWHYKEEKDENFIKLFPLLKKASTDEHNFVKKAVNWAIRNMGKRSKKLNKECIKLAKEIQRLDSKSARWIAADAIRELESEAVQKRLNK